MEDAPYRVKDCRESSNEYVGDERGEVERVGRPLIISAILDKVDLDNSDGRTRTLNLYYSKTKMIPFSLLEYCNLLPFCALNTKQ